MAAAAAAAVAEAINPISTGEEPTPPPTTTPISRTSFPGKTPREPRQAPREPRQDLGTMLPPFPPLTNGNYKKLWSFFNKI